MRNQSAVNTGATSHDPDSLFPFGKKASGSLHLLDGEFLMGDPLILKDGGLIIDEIFIGDNT